MADYTQPGPVYKALLPSPFQIIQFAERNRQLNEEREAKRLQRAMEESSKTLDKAFQYKANPVISQYQGYFDNQVKDIYSKAKDLYYGSDSNGKMQVAQQMSQVDGELNQVKDIEEQMNKVRELAKGDIYDRTWVNNNLYSVIYNPDGTLKHPSQLDAEQPYRLLDNANAYNIAKINEDYAKTVDETISTSFKNTTSGGIKFQDKYKQASKFAKLDPNGNPVYDKDTGRLQLEVTPEQVNKYLQNTGGRLWAEKLVAEKNDPKYTLASAVKDLLSSSGYVSKPELADRETLDKSGLNLNFFGGSAEKHAQYTKGAEYFYNLIHGDEKTKNTLLGDISQGKEFAASFQKKPEGAPASNRGYVVLNYDPLSRFGDIMDEILSGQLEKRRGMSEDEAKSLIDKSRKEHKIVINLDNEEQAWRELNYWRNLSKNQDLNSDILKDAYNEYATKNRTKKGKFDSISKPKGGADDL